MKNNTKLSFLVKPLIAATAVAGLAAFVLSGCNSANSKAADAAAAGGPPISAANVVEKQIVETQEFSGRLEAIERVQIRSRQFAKRQMTWFRHLPGCRPVSRELTATLWGVTM